MEDNSLCLSLRPCVCVYDEGRAVVTFACNPKVICSSDAIFAMVRVIQGETKQFPPALSLSPTYIHVAGSS